MKKLHLMVVGVALAALAIFVVWFGQPVSAHEHRDVGKYQLTFGWRVEPAFVGVYNGPEVFIKQLGATDADDILVVGAEKTLKLKVIFGNQSKELKLAPAWKDPGHYVAYLTPTRAGDYVFQLTGTLTRTGAISATTKLSTSGTVTQTDTLSTTATVSPTIVNEKFTSADGHFSSVEPASDVLFPDTKFDAANLQTEVDALKAQLAEFDTLKAQIKALQDDLATLKAKK